MQQPSARALACTNLPGLFLRRLRFDRFVADRQCAAAAATAPLPSLLLPGRMTSRFSSTPASAAAAVQQPANLTPLPSIEQLSPRVWRVLGANPSPVTLLGTNSYIIGTGDSRILLDASNSPVPEYVRSFRRALAQIPCRIGRVVASHGHPDHVDGILDLARAGLLGGTLPVRISKLAEPDGSDERLPCSEFIQYEHIADGDTVSAEGATLVAYHTPGHRADHLVFRLREEDAVFTADLILGEGSTTVEDLAQYMKSLELVERLNPGGRLYPAHGPLVENGLERVQQYIAHRRHREHQVLEALAVSRRNSLGEIVDRVYTDTDISHAMIRRAATQNVKQHLIKLIADGICMENEQEGTFSLCTALKEK